jgi:hypothetical protein
MLSTQSRTLALTGGDDDSREQHIRSSALQSGRAAGDIGATGGRGISEIRLQIQRLRTMGLPRTPSGVLPPRPSRLPFISDRKIHPVGPRFSGQIGILLLLLARLSIHHQNHSPLGSQVPLVNRHKEYHAHVKGNPHTLISRFYGLYRVKLPHGHTIHFVIMNNLFPPHKDIHETYDLKGSTVGRKYPEEKAALKPRAALEDLN